MITLQATEDIANAGTHNPTVFGNGRYRRRVKSYSSDLYRMQPCTLRNTPFAIFIRSVCCIDRIQLCQAFYLVYKRLFSCTVLTGSQWHVTYDAKIFWHSFEICDKKIVSNKSSSVEFVLVSTTKVTCPNLGHFWNKNSEHRKNVTEETTSPNLSFKVTLKLQY